MVKEKVQMRYQGSADMNIAVVGLGLIGGSLCKAIKEKCSYTLFGFDTDSDVCEKALKEKCVDEIIEKDKLGEADITFVCLHPETTIKFIKKNAQQFKKGSIVCDVCGVKEYITEKCEGTLKKNDVCFVGTHPMAGREFSGFDYSQSRLFDGADFIITRTDNTDKDAAERIASLAKEIGFGEIVYSTPEEHDRIIAYTSQLAHIVSSAYIKSPTLEKQPGFSAGSFLDMTRVAKLNEKMWASLFLMNRKAIKFELDMLIAHLKQFRSAIKYEDDEELIKLLADGRKRKEKNIKVNSNRKSDTDLVEEISECDSGEVQQDSSEKVKK